MTVNLQQFTAYLNGMECQPLQASYFESLYKIDYYQFTEYVNGMECQSLQATNYQARNQEFQICQNFSLDIRDAYHTQELSYPQPSSGFKGVRGIRLLVGNCLIKKAH